MMTVFGSPLEKLKDVDALIRSEIHYQESPVETHLNIKLNSLEKYICPAIFLAGVGMTKVEKKPKTIISLASCFQYLFLANRVHRLVGVRDMTDDARQYPVLIGDYFFGLVFTKLSDKELFQYSNQFVRMIEIINEGVLARWSMKNKTIPLKEFKSLIGVEKATITAAAGKIGAEISGIQEQYVKKIEDFGYFLGLAWAALGETAYLSLVPEYLAKAKEVILELNDKIPAKPLMEVYDFFTDKKKDIILEDFTAFSQKNSEIRHLNPESLL